MKTRPLNAALASDITNDVKVADDNTDDEEEDSQSQCPDTDAEEEPDLVIPMTTMRRRILNRSVTIQMQRKRAMKNLCVMQISIAAKP